MNSINTQTGENFICGQNVVVENDVVIGHNVTLGHNVIIKNGVRIGNNVTISDNSVIGQKPRKSRFSTLKIDESANICSIGDNVYIGALSIVYSNTIIGSDTLVADQASVRENCQIGSCVIIGRNAYVENDCSIGDRTKLQANSYITAKSILEENVFIAPCVATTNDNFMGRTKERFQHTRGIHAKKGARIGGNSTILPGKTIGEDGVVGAGSVVTKDVPDKTIVVGCPARVYKIVPEEQLLENQEV